MSISIFYDDRAVSLRVSHQKYKCALDLVHSAIVQLHGCRATQEQLPS